MISPRDVRLAIEHAARQAFHLATIALLLTSPWLACQALDIISLWTATLR